MKKTVISGLALALVIGLSSVAQAQEDKMTREEYVAQMADLQQRETAAQQQIEALSGQIVDLNGQMNACDLAIADLNDQVRMLVEATDAQIDAFGNRLDAIIQFSSLDERSIARVVDKLVLELEAQLDKNNVTLELEPDGRAWIAERGYDPAMGARPMARVIQEFIKRPLAEELLFGALVDGGHVRITVSDDGESLSLIPEPVTPELEHLPE